MEVKSSWQQLTVYFNEEVESNLGQQYHASQFIALVGRYLIPKKPDGSNINMQYVPEKEMLLGNQHPDGWVIGVQLKDLSVQILNNKLEPVIDIPLKGKTFENGFQELKSNLEKLGVDVSGLLTKQPYELPTDSLKDGKYFSIGNKEAVRENILYRHHAGLIINEQAARFEDVEPVRIWPHHFDTGTFITLARNGKGDATKTIGLGWAIPDSMVAEPYFYLSFWSESQMEITDEFKTLPSGEWMMPTWNGAVLKTSEISTKPTANEQYGLVKSFFESGLEILIEKLN